MKVLKTLAWSVFWAVVIAVLVYLSLTHGPIWARV